jgi:hypothetical protein
MCARNRSVPDVGEQEHGLLRHLDIFLRKPEKASVRVSLVCLFRRGGGSKQRVYLIRMIFWISSGV